MSDQTQARAPEAARPALSEALKPEDVPVWVQIRAGNELGELIGVLRFAHGQQPIFFHSNYDVNQLIWRWALKWARPMAAQPLAPAPQDYTGLIQRIRDEHARLSKKLADCMSDRNEGSTPHNDEGDMGCDRCDEISPATALLADALEALSAGRTP